jgi:hypothetical protein
MRVWRRAEVIRHPSRRKRAVLLGWEVRVLGRRTLLSLGTLGSLLGLLSLLHLLHSIYHVSNCSQDIDEYTSKLKGPQKEGNGKYPHGFALSVV